jgi:hypothetical protein
MHDGGGKMHIGKNSKRKGRERDENCKYETENPWNV